MTIENKDRLEGGYTLAELLAVLAIISLMAMLLPGLIFADSPGLKLRQATDALIVELRSARNAANLGGEVVSFGDLSELDMPDGIQVEIKGAEGGRAIYFMPQGGSSGGRILVTSSGLSATIHVDWLTGRISKSDGSES